jgi:hypothetical protein
LNLSKSDPLGATPDRQDSPATDADIKNTICLKVKKIGEAQPFQAGAKKVFDTQHGRAG